MKTQSRRCSKDLESLDDKKFGCCIQSLQVWAYKQCIVGEKKCYPSASMWTSFWGLLAQAPIVLTAIGRSIGRGYVGTALSEAHLFSHDLATFSVILSWCFFPVCGFMRVLVHWFISMSYLSHMFPVFSPCFPMCPRLFADGFPRFFPGPQNPTGRQLPRLQSAASEGGPEGSSDRARCRCLGCRMGCDIMGFNGDSMGFDGIWWDLMVIQWDLKRFIVDLLGLNGYLMGFNRI